MQGASSTVIELKPPPNSAEAWCARLHADDLTEADRRAFQAWLAVSPENRAEYELCALTFGVARGLPAAADLRPASNEPSSQKLLFALVAGVASVVCIAGYLAWRAASPSYSTDVGEQKLVALSDGSTVQLNTATAIGVDLKPAERAVTLLRGEAFFNVAPNPRQPFIVKAGASEIRVIGTKFNVRLDGDTASVVVLEGHVKVSGDARKSIGAATVPLDLRSGQAADVAENSSARQIIANPARITSWREGKIYFDRDPLATVIAEVNRYSEAQFVIRDPAVQALILTGVFRTGDTDSVAFALRETYGLTTQRDGRRILVF